MFLRTAFLLSTLLFLASLDSSGCFQTAVQPSKGSAVTVSTELAPAECAVCTVDEANATSCHSLLSLVPEAEVTLLFNCSQPLETAFTVTVHQSIGEFDIQADERRRLVQIFTSDSVQSKENFPLECVPI
ncbi:hypothetical protein OJAV_G00114830 [Oryzias javanicus]|uniref:CDCP1 first CUB domain-containing protein n=1 Tax=Oryzias javanicus TaxID=123683 RepID=A0A437CWU7_ORYJA|nr:hypothetical protein OJAV_G00114830 [Oryzias javanicus]